MRLKNKSQPPESPAQKNARCTQLVESEASLDQKRVAAKAYISRLGIHKIQRISTGNQYGQQRPDAK